MKKCLRLKSKILEEKCGLCYDCLKLCPAHAISIVNPVRDPVLKDRAFLKRDKKIEFGIPALKGEAFYNGVNKNVGINKSKCVGCMCCYELCANRAIVVDYSIFAKIYFNKGKIVSLPKNIIKYIVRFLKNIIHAGNHIF